MFCVQESYKSKGNSLVSVAAANILMVAFQVFSLLKQIVFNLSFIFLFGLPVPYCSLASSLISDHFLHFIFKILFLKLCFLWTGRETLARAVRPRLHGRCHRKAINQSNFLRAKLIKSPELSTVFL